MAAAQTAKFEKVGSIERLDPAVDAILPADAAIEKIGDDCKWTEGPIWVRGGYLLFADIPNNCIMKWTPMVGSACSCSRAAIREPSRSRALNRDQTE